MGETNTTLRMGERDYPEGHPSASDYAGQTYDPPKSPHGEDFAKGHPARLGANIPEAEIAERRRFEQTQKDEE